MRSELVRALRGVSAAASLLAFVALFLALEARVASPTVLGGLAAVAVATLSAAAGPSGVRRLLGAAGSEAGEADEPTGEADAWLDESTEDAPWSDRADREGDEPETDWALARLEPALDDAWNRWSDATLTLGLAALGVGSLVLIATYPGDDPPLGLVLLLLFGFNGALVTLPFLFKDG
jgi:hypothetical protein